MSNDNVTLNAHPCPTEKQRVTARQVDESLSTEELRHAAKELRTHPEDTPSTEDIAQLLEYIADLKDANMICPHCGWDYIEKREAGYEF